MVLQPLATIIGFTKKLEILYELLFPISSKNCRQELYRQGVVRHYEIKDLKAKKHPEVAVLSSLYQPTLQEMRLWSENMSELIDKENCIFMIALVSADPILEKPLLSMVEEMNANASVFLIPSAWGLYQTWNFLIANSSSVYVTNANLDDRRFPTSISVMRDYLANNPKVGVVYGHSTFETKSGLVKKRLAKDLTLNRLMIRGVNDPHCAPMWRRSTHEIHGLFDESYSSGGDTEYWLRCLLGGVRFRALDFTSVHSNYNRGHLSSVGRGCGRIEWSRTIDRHARSVFRYWLRYWRSTRT